MQIPPPPPEGCFAPMKSKCCNSNIKHFCPDIRHMPPDMNFDNLILYYCLKCEKLCKLKTK